MSELYRLLGEILSSVNPFIALRICFKWHEKYEALVGRGWVLRPVRSTPAQYKDTYDRMRQIYESEHAQWLPAAADAWMQVQLMLIPLQHGDPGASFRTFAHVDPTPTWVRFWHAFLHGSPTLHAQLYDIFYDHLRPDLLEHHEDASMQALNAVLDARADASVGESISRPSTQAVLQSMGWESVITRDDMDPHDGRRYHVFGIRPRQRHVVAGGA